MYGYYMYKYAELDPYVSMFNDHCASCHGDDLKGGPKGLALIGNRLQGGDTVAGLIESIHHRNPSEGMPVYKGQLTELQIKGLAIYIAERRLGQRFTDFRYEGEIVIPSESVQTQSHEFITEVLPMTWTRCYSV
jgi:hypothetical protein